MNPRYLAYCRAHGRDPKDMLAFDDQRFPGGSMCGFILWLSARWSEWKDRHPELAPRFGGSWVLSDKHHADFDREIASFSAVRCQDRCCN
jgi:hypothetical protein